MIEVPGRPPRPVRPTRCVYLAILMAVAESIPSKMITFRTLLKSTPRCRALFGAAPESARRFLCAGAAVRASSSGFAAWSASSIDICNRSALSSVLSVQMRVATSPRWNLRRISSLALVGSVTSYTIHATPSCCKKCSNLYVSSSSSAKMSVFPSMSLRRNKEKSNVCLWHSDVATREYCFKVGADASRRRRCDSTTAPESSPLSACSSSSRARFDLLGFPESSSAVSVMCTGL
mmetsp:Transcript_83092/g.97092  ORF Transcript_83092/g.97092 Transcript_83092/m.97092 type:complete len:234 (-) Transcript_83092:61-762(-)